ncbi:MAG: hypothetical protein HYZ48_00275, partial [Chlamydiales bacterium]|nr:hypothetical protein [Chlamydiales bacterium]
MHPSVSQNPWIEKTKFLTQALIISVTLNVGLLATFAYSVFKDKERALSVESKPVVKQIRSEISNEQVLRAYSLLPYSELLLRLDQEELIEEGFAKRDIALACLVAFHHFNLESALGGVALQQRHITLHHGQEAEAISVAVYPGLADFQFRAVLNYARTEKWPLTAQGLFYELQRNMKPYEDSLIEAFSLSPEFHAVQTLFNKSGSPLAVQTLFDLLIQGNWEMVAELAASQRQGADLSVDRRRSFLLRYLENRSPLAAELLLSTDAEFVLKHLDDSRILRLLDLLNSLNPQLEELAKALVLSSRTDAVWKKSASILYAAAQESLPEPYEHDKT